MLPSTAAPYKIHVERFFSPPRSRLYHLKPEGIGTPFVESLTSYITRLAYAYRIQPRVLILQEILPLLKISAGLKPENRLQWLKGSTTINGATTLVTDWVQALERLTLRSNLRFLTMLSWSGVLPENDGIVRDTRAWCPTCYHEWQRAGTVIFEPLIWNLRAVAICPRHSCSLLTRCPNCEQSLPLLIDWLSPGHCPKCKGFLGFPQEKEAMQASVSEEREWDQWVSSAIADVVAAAPTLTTMPGKDQIASGLSAYIEQSGGSKIAPLARYLGVDGSKLISWQRGLHLPEFEVTLRLCRRMGITPLRFLTQEVRAFLFEHPFHGSPPGSNDGNSRPSIEEVRLELERLSRSADCFSPSLQAVARRLHYPVQVLRRMFPELCNAISQNYQKLMDPDHQRRALEAVLVEPELQSLTLNEVARRLGCTAFLLKYRFPHLCRPITQRYRKKLDLAAMGLALDAILQSKEEPPPTINEVLLRLGCSSSSLYLHFPEACHAITERYQRWLCSQRSGESKTDCTSDAPSQSRRRPSPKSKLVAGDTPNFPRGTPEPRLLADSTSAPAKKAEKMSNSRKSVVIEQLRRELELVLASQQEPLPTVKEVAKRLGYSCATLYEYFPEMCHAIAKRRRRPVDFNGLRRELEAILAGNHEPYPSLREVSERLGCPGTTLRRLFPEQCRAIVQRHRHGSGRDGHSVTISAVQNSDVELETTNTKKSNAGPRGIAADIDRLRTALEEVLTSRENPPPTMKEVARRLGYSSSALYHYFPRQCRAIAERHRASARQRIDRLKRALEEVLAKKEPPFPTVQEVAKNLGCSDGTLYHHFPEYCHAIAKRHQLDRDFIRQSLAAILASDDYPPSVSEVARGLGCSIQTLSEYFPQECKEIKARHWKLEDTDKQRQMLEAVLASDRPISWSLKEIARQLGCSRSTLYRRFPELYREILKRRWMVSDTDRLRQVLEAALLEDPPPTLRELAGRLGCSEKNIQYYFPDLCRAVTARHRAATDWANCQRTLESALESSEEPVSMQEIARRLGVSDDSLRKRFPTLCTAISARYLAYRKNRRVEKIKRMRDQVRQATVLLHARGEYPNTTRVAAFLDSPARFRNPAVRDAWRETMRELGYDL